MNLCSKSWSGLADPILRYDLYHRDQYRWPMDEITDEMRRAIRVELDHQHPPAFTVQFQYPDRLKALESASSPAWSCRGLSCGASRWPASAWADNNRLRAQYALRDAIASIRPQITDVIQSASLPELPASPNRLFPALGGLLAGFTIGAERIKARGRQTSRPPMPDRA